MKEQYTKKETGAKVLAEYIAPSTKQRKSKRYRDEHDEIRINSHWLIEHEDGNITKLSDKKFKARYELIEKQNK
jgi:hypothetical protein